MDTVKTGNLIANLRRGRGLTQSELGELLGVTNKTVSRWETGSYMPPAESMCELAKTLGVTVDELLLGECRDQPAAPVSKWLKAAAIALISSALIIAGSLGASALSRNLKARTELKRTETELVTKVKELTNEQYYTYGIDYGGEEISYEISRVNDILNGGRETYFVSLSDRAGAYKFADYGGELFLVADTAEPLGETVYSGSFRLEEVAKPDYGKYDSGPDSPDYDLICSKIASELIEYEPDEKYITVFALGKFPWRRDGDSIELLIKFSGREYSYCSANPADSGWGFFGIQYRSPLEDGDAFAERLQSRAVGVGTATNQ